MPTISITVTDSQASRITSALRNRYAKIEDRTQITDTMTNSELARHFIIHLLKHMVTEEEQKVAIATANASIQTF